MVYDKMPSTLQDRNSVSSDRVGVGSIQLPPLCLWRISYLFVLLYPSIFECYKRSRCRKIGITLEFRILRPYIRCHIRGHKTSQWDKHQTWVTNTHHVLLLLLLSISILMIMTIMTTISFGFIKLIYNNNWVVIIIKENICIIKKCIIKLQLHRNY